MTQTRRLSAPFFALVVTCVAAVLMAASQRFDPAVNGKLHAASGQLYQVATERQALMEDLK